MVASQGGRGSHTVISPRVAYGVLLPCYQRRQTQALPAFGLRRPWSRGPLGPKHARQHRYYTFDCAGPARGTKGRGRAMKRNTRHMRRNIFLSSYEQRHAAQFMFLLAFCILDERTATSFYVQMYILGAVALLSWMKHYPLLKRGTDVQGTKLYGILVDFWESRGR